MRQILRVDSGPGIIETTCLFRISCEWYRCPYGRLQNTFARTPSLLLATHAQGHNVMDKVLCRMYTGKRSRSGECGSITLVASYHPVRNPVSGRLEARSRHKRGRVYRTVKFNVRHNPVCSFRTPSRDGSLPCSTYLHGSCPPQAWPLRHGSRR